MKLLFNSRHKNTGNNDHVFVYNLRSSPYDISTCTFHSETINISSDEFLKEVKLETPQILDCKV